MPSGYNNEKKYMFFRKTDNNKANDIPGTYSTLLDLITSSFRVA